MLVVGWLAAQCLVGCVSTNCNTRGTSTIPAGTYEGWFGGDDMYVRIDIDSNQQGVCYCDMDGPREASRFTATASRHGGWFELERMPPSGRRYHYRLLMHLRDGRYEAVIPMPDGGFVAPLTWMPSERIARRDLASEAIRRVMTEGGE